MRCAASNLGVIGMGLRNMRHFQDCLDAEREPSPGVLDGAKTAPVGIAAWASVRTGQATKPFNAFRQRVRRDGSARCQSRSSIPRG